MPKTILIVAIALAMSACASSPDTYSNDDGAAAPTESEAKKPKMKCRTIETAGSRLGKRVCTPVEGN